LVVFSCSLLGGFLGGFPGGLFGDPLQRLCHEVVYLFSGLGFRAQGSGFRF
jgi:hypothetical protein